MHILVDDREDDERIAKLRNYFPDLEVERLISGDIAILQEGKKDILIETKTIQDFITSCRNRQIQKEALQMKELTPFSFIIIYDDFKMNEQYVTQQTNNEKFGNIASLMIRYKTPVFVASNFKQFVSCISSIINNIDKSTEPLEYPIVRKKDSNAFVNVLIGIDGVGKQTARTLLKNFKKPSKVLTATEDELDKIPRLSKKAKNNILRM